MDAQQFEAAYGSVADDLASKTGLNRVLFLAQFALETGWGTSQLASHNNLAGIKYTGFFGSDFGGFASYDSLNQFESDYIRVLSLPFYDNVRASRGQSVNAQMVALGNSPWDAGHYNNGGGPGSSLEAFAGDFGVSPSPPPPPSGNFTWYTVVRGDTLSGIAARFNVAGGYPTLFELNRDRISNPNLIYIGEQIRIPSSTPAPPPPPSSSTTDVPTSGHDYVVKHGDSYWAIAQTAYGDGNRWREIASANPQHQKLFAGNVLHIP